MSGPEITKEWIAEKAALEGDSEIMAGKPDYVPPFVPSAADRYYSAVIEQYQASVASLTARVAELEAENKSLSLDKQDLIDALQPLLGCADYAREQDLSGHEMLIVSASEAYEANSIHERVLNRAALNGGGNNG